MRRPVNEVGASSTAEVGGAQLRVGACRHPLPAGLIYESRLRAEPFGRITTLSVCEAPFTFGSSGLSAKPTWYATGRARKSDSCAGNFGVA